jgi:hypothetical protein
VRQGGAGFFVKCESLLFGFELVADAVDGMDELGIRIHGLDLPHKCCSQGSAKEVA